MTLAILVRAEAWKLVRRWFFPAAVVAVIVGGVAWAFLELWFRRSGLLEGPYRTVHALQIFLFSFRAGLFLSTSLSLFSAALMLCSEFDHGTVKTLLTRPVARWEVFAAKAIVAVLFYLFLVALAILVGLCLGGFLGTLGPIWDAREFMTTSSEGEAWATTWKLVAVSVPAGLAVVGLGLLVSTWIDHSGFAVGLAILLLLVVHAGTGFLPERAAVWVYSYYPQYAFETAGVLLRGGADVTWRPEEIEEWRLPAKVKLPRYAVLPLLYFAAALAASYPRFHRRDIFA